VLLEVVAGSLQNAKTSTRTELIREEGDEINSSLATATANERVIWRLPASWMPLATQAAALHAAVAKRFPVPQDNFVPVAISSNCLVGFTTQIGSDGKLERDSEALNGTSD
jgi:hypothetical protein